jgi:DNA-binding transcriptional MerR regulator
VDVDKAPDAFRTISEVAEDLDVPQHVLRFWESRFSQIRPMKRGGGRRYYRPDDVDLLRGIRHLLYGQGYTIRGVQRILREQGPRYVQAVWQEGAPQPPISRGEGAAGDRGMFGLWPAMGAKEDLDPEDAGVGEEEDDPQDHEEQAPPHVRLAAAPQDAPMGLPPDEIKRLRMTLDALLACRALLDSVLDDQT